MTKEGQGKAVKFGEWPPFGPRVSAKVINLLGPDRELFLLGRRAESQGMGIGAFAYYRRVVENQWSRLLGRILSVSKKLGAPEETWRALENAGREHRFSRALDIAKDAIPDAIRIDNHNPLALLHKATSEGLHARTDGECLRLARAIRTVLTDLAERLSELQRDRSTVREAIGQLLNRSGKKATEEEDGPSPVGSDAGEAEPPVE